MLIEVHIPKLKERRESRLAVERMLELIAQITDFIREKAPKSVFSAFHASVFSHLN